MLDLNPIKSLLEDVTPGPWTDETTCDGGLVVYIKPPESKDKPYTGYWLFFGDVEDTIWEDHANAAFVAHAREIVPQLIAEIERLREGA